MRRLKPNLSIRYFLLVDSHAHLDDSAFDADRDEMLQRAREAGVERHSGYRLQHSCPGRSRRHRRAARLDLLRRRSPSARSQTRHASALRHAESAWRRIPSSSPGAKLASTTTTTIRRATCSSASSSSSSIWPAPPACPSSSTAARPGPTACRSSIATGARPGWAASCTAFRARSHEARQGIDMGFMVSFAANVTYPKAQNLRDIARELPLENLLTETDSPYLAPQPTARQAKRAGARRRSSKNPRTCEKLAPGRIRRGHYRQFSALFSSGRTSRRLGEF